MYVFKRKDIQPNYEKKFPWSVFPFPGEFLFIIELNKSIYNKRLLLVLQKSKKERSQLII